MAKGDHIRVRRWKGIYSHHGIDMGDGTVVHFSGEPLQVHKACVVRDSMEDFLAGGVCKVVEHPSDCHDAEEVVARALALVGTRGYGLWTNNCEHFACYCKTGMKRSSQVRRVLQASSGLAASVTIAVGAIALASLARRGNSSRTA